MAQGRSEVEERSVDAVVDAQDLVEVGGAQGRQAGPPAAEVVADVGPGHEAIDEAMDRGRQSSGARRDDDEPVGVRSVAAEGRDDVRVEAAVRIEVGEHDRP
jgi:hypothetical protein